MRSNDVTDDLAEGFEVGPPPPMGADGSPLLTPLRPLGSDPPRLCEAGPCRHYHTFQIQMDTEQPRASRAPDGSLVEHGKVFHVETHHYCYPESGIETRLGSLPVLQCNRWSPLDDTELMRMQNRCEQFLHGPRGQVFQAKREAWESGSPAKDVAPAAITTDVIRAGSAADSFTDEVSATIHYYGGTQISRFSTWRSMRQVLDRFKGKALELNGDLVENLDATFEQLGVTGMCTIVIISGDPK